MCCCGQTFQWRTVCHWWNRAFSVTIKMEFPQPGNPHVIFIIIIVLQSDLRSISRPVQLIKAPLNGALSPKILWQFLFVLEPQLLKQIYSFHVTSVIRFALDSCLWASGVVKNVPTHEGLWKPSAQTAIYLFKSTEIKLSNMKHWFNTDLPLNLYISVVFCCWFYLQFLSLV